MRNMVATLAIGVAVLATSAARAGDALLPAGLVFGNIDGGQIALDDYAGQPLLVANTASLCGFAEQFIDLQALYDRHRAQGLVVLAVPSDDFNQELASEDEVAEYCSMTFGIDMPMTTITPVVGADAHPFFQWLAQEHGFAPGWNFNKVLIGADGRVLGTWGSSPRPDRGAIAAAVDASLGG